MMPSAGRYESVAVQEGRGDEPPLRSVVFPCEQSALALWLTNDRYTIHGGLRVEKRPVLLTHGHACEQRYETISSCRTSREGTWGALPRALLYRPGGTGSSRRATGNPANAEVQSVRGRPKHTAPYGAHAHDQAKTVGRLERTGRSHCGRTVLRSGSTERRTVRRGVHELSLSLTPCVVPCPWDGLLPLLAVLTAPALRWGSASACPPHSPPAGSLGVFRPRIDQIHVLSDVP